jgi:hypothetical protein
MRKSFVKSLIIGIVICISIVNCGNPVQDLPMPLITSKVTTFINMVEESVYICDTNNLLIAEIKPFTTRTVGIPDDDTLVSIVDGYPNHAKFSPKSLATYKLYYGVIVEVKEE